MSTSMKILYEIWLRLKLFVFGVLFYEVKDVVNLKKDFVIKRFLDNEEGHIELTISKIHCKDYLLIRGELREVDYYSYIVTSSSSIDAGDHVKLLDSRQFFFNARINKIPLDEERVIEVIADIFLDFVSSKKSVISSNNEDNPS